jgi:hypothetical protein
MAWTYKQLQTAVAVLSPAPGTPDVAAAAINAQTTTAAQDIAVAAIEAIIVPTGELYAITQAAAKVPSGQAPPTAEDQVIAAAWSFTQMLGRWTTIQASNPALWSACQTVMAGLQAAGLLSASSVAAIAALQTASVPTWQPVVNAGDIQTAQAQP